MKNIAITSHFNSVRATPSLLALRVRVIGAGVCLVFWCSCTTFPNWDADDSIRPPLPAETAFDIGAGRGGLIYLRLHTERLGELVFAVDSGAQWTALDKSLEPKLGRRLGSVETHTHYGVREGGAYKDPRLYLGNTRLLTGGWVATDDLSRIPFPNSLVNGILGMDCLRHYCVQLDFADRKIRFLDPDGVKNEELGNGFPLTISSNRVFVDANLLGVKGASSLIDTGDNTDGALAPKLFQQELEEQGLTNHVKRSAHTGSRKALFPSGVFGGETYPDLRLWESSGGNTIGLRFLARHLVTLNFPKRIMYLKRTSVGPLPDGLSSTNASPDTGREGDPALRLPIVPADITLDVAGPVSAGREFTINGCLPERLAGATVRVALERPLASAPGGSGNTACGLS
jgi:hypothetical protein